MASKMYLEDDQYNPVSGAVTYTRGGTVNRYRQPIPASGAVLDSEALAQADTLIFHADGYTDYSVPSSLIAEGDNRLLMIKRESPVVPFVLGLVAALVFAFSVKK